MKNNDKIWNLALVLGVISISIWAMVAYEDYKRQKRIDDAFNSMMVESRKLDSLTNLVFDKTDSLIAKTYKLRKELYELENAN